MAEAAKALDIDHLINPAPKNRIDKVGIELEGGWRTLPKGVRLVRDGSVFNDMPPAHDVHIGELPSDPMIPAQIPLWVKRSYPQFVDATCGLHVHVSFQVVKHYMLLMVPEFPATVREYVKRWAVEENLVKAHPLWARLADKSRFCQQQFWPDKQVKTKRKDHDQARDGHRYTDVNYCFGTYGTMEFRLLPMMSDADQALRAIKRLLTITNASLVVLKSRQAKQAKDRTTLRDSLVNDVTFGNNDEYVEYCQEAL